MNDYIVRATACDESIRAFAITSKNMVEEARHIHNTSPVVTAALGRMLSAGAMMGITLKGEDDLMTLQLQGEGPLRGITVTAKPDGFVKGYPYNSCVDLPIKNGKLDVGGSIFPGVLRVIKDMGLKEPYAGTVELQTGEIAEDLTYYFAASEQTPSSVGLGVLVDKDLSVSCAGGFIVQLMPECSDDAIDMLEKNLTLLPSVTDMLSDGMTPEDMLKKVLEGFNFEFREKHDIGLYCDCSRERVERSIAALNKKDLSGIVNDNKPVEVTCQFCGKKYEFPIEEIAAYLKTTGSR